MKVKVKGFFHLKDALGGRTPLELDEEIGTIRELLDYLSARFGKDLESLIFDPETKAFAGHLILLVNGRNYLSLPDRLDSRLEEGDEVALFPPLAGG